MVTFETRGESAVHDMRAEQSTLRATLGYIFYKATLGPPTLSYSECDFLSRGNCVTVPVSLCLYLGQSYI